MKNRLFGLGLIAAMALCCCACSDSDSDEDSSDIVKLDKWIGSPCTCEGNGCVMGTIPLPFPLNNEGSIKGCENIDLTGINGGVIACLPTIPEDQATMAPPTYFPQGYCAISAVSIPDKTVCGMGACYGDTNAMTKCPAGTVMIDSQFNYVIADMFDVLITDKVCVKKCNSDSDCNTDGEISCVEKSGHKFCYNEKNFSFLGDKINYTDF